MVGCSEVLERVAVEPKMILTPDLKICSLGHTSGSGQKLVFEPRLMTSDLLRTADILRAGRPVSKVPGADLKTLICAGGV